MRHIIRQCIVDCDIHRQDQADRRRARMSRQNLEGFIGSHRQQPGDVVAEEIRLAVVGAGLIGRCHVDAINATTGATLACIVDPSPKGRSFADTCGVNWFASVTAMFAASQIDGAILATPSQMHADGALVCIKNRCPVLVEKPLCTTVPEAENLVRHASRADIPVLTGHHRRHGAILKQAKALIDGGTLGTVTAFQGTCWFYKPDEYFDVTWRSQPGGGPVFINLIHDIDTMLYLLGDVSSVQAITSNRIRGSAVEDTAAILLRFASGVLGTVTVSDTTVSPWSWEMTSGENPVYPATTQTCYLIGGTQAALSVPDLTLWRHDGPPSWLSPVQRQTIAVDDMDPLEAQIRQFVAVIRGEEPPLVSAEDGLRTLRVVQAIAQSGATGETVTFS